MEAREITPPESSPAQSTTSVLGLIRDPYRFSLSALYFRRRFRHA